MTVILTSFKYSSHFNGEKFSVARFQPKGFSMPSLDFLAAHDEYGNKLQLSNFIEPISGYENALKKAYEKRWVKIQQWLNGLPISGNIILCCWCPYSNDSKEQIKEFNTFACHNGIIGQIINKYRPDIEIILDEDREKKLIKQWRPEQYSPEDITI